MHGQCGMADSKSWITVEYLGMEALQRGGKGHMSVVEGVEGDRRERPSQNLPGDAVTYVAPPLATFLKEVYF